ncbi:hypothetical protein HKD37_18G049794 [Glycine soja]|uniref:Uncharacterized protein n=1 Tax=Glycine soja TaxID=3848 RepID=A0A0B2PFA7_GLYSO|nr:uncharacterized protein LOC114395409 [Glycine soja]KAG4923626.1 hypothetical protein JHK87_049166 [Glycine soja]KHN06224.1 hypothetical protein glysoja_030290 [Glycine soja]RZB50924.1 hypothetical protein D0Y65_047678 [Glycine soja]
MKKLSSTSSHASPSSLSTTSLDPTMCTSKSTTSGCLTAILRKILCSDGLPRDQIRELDSSNAMLSGKDQNLKAKQNTEIDTTTTTTSATSIITTTTTPGIVARLMGLETIEIPCGSKPNSLSRSRSMNSVDYLGVCNGMEEVLHKRVKSTLSFREAPTFLLHESDKFLELSFEGEGGEGREFKSNGRKREPGCAELKQKVRSERGELRENKREKVCDEKVLIEKGKLGKKRVSDVSSGSVGSGGKLQEITNTLHPSKASSEKKKCFDDYEAVKLSQNMKCKEVAVGEKQKRRRKKKKTICQKENKIEVETKSEDSSPVSVLDFEREACATVGLSARRKLSPKLDNDQHLPVRSDGNLMIDDESKVEAIDNNKHEGSKKKEMNGQEYIDIWVEVCRIVEDELAESNKIHIWTNKQGDLGSISADFESEIFDHLLNELVDQLAGIH